MTGLVAMTGIILSFLKELILPVIMAKKPNMYGKVIFMISAARK
jgi:hypothetical protein